MTPNHKVLRLVFAFGVGLLVAWYSFQWVSDPERAARRAVEEGIVLEGRAILRQYVTGDAAIDISDPLERIREAGKVYIYPTPDGWELSGHYQRPGESRWHPFLMTLDRDGRLESLLVQDNDPAVIGRADDEPRFEVKPFR
jgi:hypothetical protein